MRYLFYLGHPAHFHLFKQVIAALKERGHEVEILIKKKDVLEELLESEGWVYRNIQQEGRGEGKVRIAWGLLKRDLAVFRVARQFRPHLMMGTSAEIAHVGRLLGIPSVVVNEDDYDVVPLFALLAYPFADALLAPTSCRMGRWADKTLYYESYHELAYLRPEHFSPDARIAKELAPEGERYFILRFAQLNAHHDAGRSGITADVASRLIDSLSPHGRVHITSERPLEPEFEPYRIAIATQDIHHALAFASLYIGDSQTMAAEAAVLGTPALRFNDFVGEISYLDELEREYELAYGFRTTEPDQLLRVVDELLARPELDAEWERRRQRLLAEKIDLARFMTWFIEQYPASVVEAEKYSTVAGPFAARHLEPE